MYKLYLFKWSNSWYFYKNFAFGSICVLKIKVRSFAKKFLKIFLRQRLSNVIYWRTNVREFQNHFSSFLDLDNSVKHITVVQWSNTQIFNVLKGFGHSIAILLKNFRRQLQKPYPTTDFNSFSFSIDWSKSTSKINSLGLITFFSSKISTQTPQNLSIWRVSKLFNFSKPYSELNLCSVSYLIAFHITSRDTLNHLFCMLVASAQWWRHTLPDVERNMVVQTWILLLDQEQSEGEKQLLRMLMRLNNNNNNSF